MLLLILIVILSEVYSFKLLLPCSRLLLGHGRDLAIALTEQPSDSIDGQFLLPNFEGITETESIIDFNEEFKKDTYDRVYDQMLLAFDHMRNEEIGNILSVIWKGQTSNAVDVRNRLVELTFKAEEIESIASSNDPRYSYENLIDNMRVIRSQIRMYGGHPEFEDATKNVIKWPWQKT